MTLTPPNPDPTLAERKRPWRAIAVALPGVVIVLVLLLAIWQHRIDAAITALKQAGPLPLFAAMVLLPLLGCPASPLYLLAGAALGLRDGIVCAAAAILINLLLTWWLSTRLLHGWLERLLARWFEVRLATVPPRYAVRFALGVKLLPVVPTFVRNYIIALSGVPFPIFLSVGWVVSFAFAAIVIVLGDSLHDRDYRIAVIAVLAAIALAILARWFARRAGRDLTDSAHPSNTS